jgi:hypothetical protein
VIEGAKSRSFDGNENFDMDILAEVVEHSPNARRKGYSDKDISGMFGGISIKNE